MNRENMSEYGAVITGISPLETALAHTHPRLHLTADKLVQLRRDIEREPWRTLYQKVQAAAAFRDVKQDSFGVQSAMLPNMALCWLLERDPQHLDHATHILLELLATTDWDGDPRKHGAAFMGRTLYEVALAYDWLHADLDSELRRKLCTALHVACARQVEVVALQQHYFSSASAHNHAGNILSDIAAASMAIYGDAPNVGLLVKVVIDRARLTTATLGPDGVSPEGICYGAYFADSLTRALDLLRDLVDVDLFATTPWFHEFPRFFAYSQLPRQHWKPRSSHFCFGDGVRYNWHGPAHFLRRLASLYRDPLAQWLANETDDAGISSNNAPYLGLIWHDETVAAGHPCDLPPARHFTDNDLVFMRSGWDGTETVMGVRCGPSAGHYALRNFRHSVGGGHMQPDAGSFQLFAHGDWLISDGGYSYKHTAYRNTILVNGRGQTGEGGEWFEDQELRREKRGPHIECFAPGEQFDYLVADLTRAYDGDVGLQRLRRHIIYLKPASWLIIDEAITDAPATLTLCFHADTPFEPDGDCAWSVRGEQGALRLASLHPAGLQQSVEAQDIESMGGHNGRTLSWLRQQNSEPVAEAVFVTALQAHPADVAPSGLPEVSMEAGRLTIVIEVDGKLAGVCIEGIGTDGGLRVEVNITD